MASRTTKDTELELLLREHAQASREEARTAPRHAYPSTQYLAPYEPGSAPSKAAFRPVRCYDLSTSGISYLSPTPVERDRVIFALRKGLEVTYLLAEIVHCVPIGSGTNLRYRVGCRFIERVDI